MISPHIELAPTVPKCNLRSEAKFFFLFLSSFFFCSGKGWGSLVTVVTCWAERMAFVLVCHFTEHLCPWQFCFGWR